MNKLKSCNCWLLHVVKKKKKKHGSGRDEFTLMRTIYTNHVERVCGQIAIGRKLSSHLKFRLLLPRHRSDNGHELHPLTITEPR